MFGIRFDKSTFGNLVKNLSPVAGLVGGPGGIALAGGLSAVGDKLRGKDISVKNALTNATLAGGVGAAKGMLSGGSSAVGASVPGAGTDAVAHGGLTLPATPNLTTAATKAVDPRSLATKALSFAKDNPTATAMGLQGLGNVATSGAANRASNAQATLLEQQAEEDAYDFEQRKRRKELFGPDAWSALGTAFGSGLNELSANPYLPKAGA